MLWLCGWAVMDNTRSSACPALYRNRSLRKQQQQTHPHFCFNPLHFPSSTLGSWQRLSHWGCYSKTVQVCCYINSSIVFHTLISILRFCISLDSVVYMAPVVQWGAYRNIHVLTWSQNWFNTVFVQMVLSGMHSFALVHIIFHQKDSTVVSF